MRSRPGRPIGWRDVLRVLEDPETRLRALTKYRTAGFTADQFASHQPARNAALESLVTTEDHLELERVCPRREAKRNALRNLRRRLESELWP